MKKNVVITGASKGIGFELAKKFLEKNHNVFGIARSQNELEELNQFANNNLITLSYDLKETGNYDRITEKIKNWKNIDVLYNNAGLLIHKPFADLQEIDFLTTWKVNFLAPALLIQKFLPRLEKNGHIVNISTMGAAQGSVKFPGLSAYSSSKAALTNLTEILAEELKEKDISVNAVCLGAVQTEMLKKAFPDFQADIQPDCMAEYLYDFGLNGFKFFNGKIIFCSKSTP